MLPVIYRMALLAVVICVLIVLIAPEVDLPDSTEMRANHGVHVVLNSIGFAVTLPLLIVMVFSSFFQKTEYIRTRFDAPSRSSLCTFRC